MSKAKTPNRSDQISLWIIIISVLAVIFILWKFPREEEIYVVVSLIGSIASTGGLIVAIIQIMELRKTAEATRTAINSTEKELSILRAIESATNCFNELNQIDEYLETNNIDSIKTLLPIATKNFHELVYFKAFELEELAKNKEELSDFLEKFAGQLTIWTNHRNMRKTEINISDEVLEDISIHLQKVKAFTNKYKNKLQQAIVKD